ncbi:MAG TPA: sigma-70 family RNA polymerase sigma factor [Verrucomicrobiae bacterium]
MVLAEEARVETQDKLDARSDLELIAAINAGECAAFEVLYFRYRDWVAGLAYRFTDDEYAAQDVLQETFLYVLRKFPGFRLTANFKTFLYPAVRNLSIAARRKAERYQAGAAEQRQLEQTPAPEYSRPSTHELEAALAGLPGEQREVLVLRFVDALSLAEIAEAMGIPLGTVKSRLHNALETLRQDDRTKEFFQQ